MTALDLQVGDLTLQTGPRRLVGPRGAVMLTGHRFAVAERLMRHPGRLVPHEALIMACWPDPDDEPDDVKRIVQIYVHKLRRTIGEISPTVALRTSWGFGYAIEAKPDAVPVAEQLAAENAELKQWCRALETAVLRSIVTTPEDARDGA